MGLPCYLGNAGEADVLSSYPAPVKLGTGGGSAVPAPVKFGIALSKSGVSGAARDVLGDTASVRLLHASLMFPLICSLRSFLRLAVASCSACFFLNSARRRSRMVLRRRKVDSDMTPSRPSFHLITTSP